MLQIGTKKSLLDQHDAPAAFQRSFGARKPLKDVKRDLASTGQGTGQILQKKDQGTGPGHLEGATTTDDRWYRLVLVNMGGKWKVLGSDVFGYGCGC